MSVKLSSITCIACHRSQGCHWYHKTRFFLASSSAANEVLYYDFIVPHFMNCCTMKSQYNSSQPSWTADVQLAELSLLVPKTQSPKLFGSVLLHSLPSWTMIAQSNWELSLPSSLLLYQESNFVGLPRCCTFTGVVDAPSY